MRLCTYSFILLAAAVADILCDGDSTVDQEKSRSVKSGIPVVISERKTRSPVFGIASELAARFSPNQKAQPINDLGSSQNTGGQYTGAYNQNIGSNFGTGVLGGLGVSNVLKAARTEAEDGLLYTGNRYRRDPRGQIYWSAGIRSEASGIYAEPSSPEMNARVSPDTNTGRVNNLGSSQNTGGENTGRFNQNIGSNFGTGLHGGLGGTRSVETPSAEEFTTREVQGDVSNAGRYYHRGERTAARFSGIDAGVISGHNGPRKNDLGSSHNIGGQHTGDYNQNIGANFGTGLDGGLGVSRILRTPSTVEFAPRPQGERRYRRETSEQMYTAAGNEGETPGSPVAPSFNWGLGVGDSSEQIRHPLNPLEFSQHVGGRAKSPVAHNNLPPGVNIGSGWLGGTGVSNNY